MIVMRHDRSRIEVQVNPTPEMTHDAAYKYNHYAKPLTQAVEETFRASEFLRWAARAN